MSYASSTLAGHEKLVYSAKVSLWAHWPSIVMGAVLLPVLGIGLLFFIASWVRRRSTELVFTDKRLIAKYGFVRRETVEIAMQKVESVQLRQSLLGRIFNYGTIVISGAGNPQVSVENIARPLEFRRAFMAAQDGIQ